MNPKDLLINNRYCSNHFNKNEYPKLIDRIVSELEEYLADMPSGDEGAFNRIIESDVESILDEVESNMDMQKFKFRRKSAFADDHIVLSLFVVPAAAKIGTPAAQKFCELLSARFVARFPGTTFRIGDYDEIMSGFKSILSIFSK